MKTKYQPNFSGGMITAILSAGLWLATSVLVVFAADFTVNDTSDAPDLNAGDGICEVTAATGDCTLRAAVMESNALAGADTISVPAGTYNLSIAGVDERCERDTVTACTSDGTNWFPVITSDASIGDLDINDDLTITGAGAEQTVIQWAPIAPDDDPLTGDRIFHVAVPEGAIANVASVVIQDLTVVNGQVGLVPTEAEDVCVDGVYTPANLNAYDIESNNNDAACANQEIVIVQFRRMGGAIALGAGYAIVTYEQAIHGPGADPGGGGGADMGPFPGGKPGEEEGFTIENVALNRVVVINNWSGADGGGVYSAAPANFDQVAISGNTGNANGGGIYNDATLTISGSLIGRVFDPDTVAQFPQFASPNIGENGGGLFDTGSHVTTIIGSAINGNEAIGGGGIAARAGITINIENSTVSNNVGKDVGGGITTNGNIKLRNVTVANNEAATDAPGGGGGLNMFGGVGSYTLNNTVLANNLVSGRAEPLANCGCSGGASACDVLPGEQFISEFYNIEDGDTCELSAASGTDLANTDPMLLALANNGGFTETHALAPDSPAIDQGLQSLCNQLATGSWGDFDQRGEGFPRTVDGNGDLVLNCDRGAYEYMIPDEAPPGATPPAIATNDDSNGCLCSYNPDAPFDPVLPGLVLAVLVYLGWRLRQRDLK